MTPEREARLEDAAEYGRRMADEMEASMRRALEERDTLLALLKDCAPAYREEPSQVARPRLVTVDGKPVD